LLCYVQDISLIVNVTRVHGCSFTVVLLLSIEFTTENISSSELLFVAFLVREFPSSVFTALHEMQTRSGDENSVRPSVRPSVCLSHACIVTKR